MTTGSCDTSGVGSTIMDKSLKLDACIQNFFFEFQLCIGGGELQYNFEKDALFYEGTQKWRKNENTALLSQGLLSIIVVW